MISCKKRRKHTELYNINVTPLVDVMLVLLVVFMITSPMLTSNIDINLPKSQNGQSTNQQKDEPVVLIIDGSGNIYVKDSLVSKENLLTQIELWSYGNKDVDIHIHGDQQINYGKIMDTISLISSAGYSKVSLVAAIENS